MGKKDHLSQKEKERVEAVLHLLKKQAPLTLKQVHINFFSFFVLEIDYLMIWKYIKCLLAWQEKYCSNNACVERFLKSKGDNVKKAAKQLRSCLAWRDSIGTGNLSNHHQ